MTIVWNGLALLFFFSLFMVSISVFTPRTALFFKEKTKLRGAILWMSVALVSAVLVNEFGPGFVPSENSNGTQASQSDAEPRTTGLPGYSFTIIEDQPGATLAIDCTLAAPVSEKILRELALKVYAANKGGSYKEVRIRWFLQKITPEALPWGRTDHIRGNWSIHINALAQPS